MRGPEPADVCALTTDRDHEQRDDEDAEREADPEPRRDSGTTLPRGLGVAVCQPDDRHEEAGEAEDDAPGADRATDDRRVLRQLAELVPGLRELLAGPGDAHLVPRGEGDRQVGLRPLQVPDGAG